jgi:uncharacterized protein
MFKRILSGALLIIVLIVVLNPLSKSKQSNKVSNLSSLSKTSTPNPQSNMIVPISELRQRNYPGSKITIEKKVASTDEFDQFITSYQSEGLKISSLLTVPKGQKPQDGWPVIVWNHGFTDPKIYGKQNDDQIGKIFAPHGYIVFQPSYRGHAGSDGEPGNNNSGYLIDDLNAISSIKQYPDANGQKIGVCGHSMGAIITLGDLVVSKDIKAGVLWSAGYVRIIDQVKQVQQLHKEGKMPDDNKDWILLQQLINEHNTPEKNPEFWNSLDPLSYLQDINIPVQIDIGDSDHIAKPRLSQELYQTLKGMNKDVEINILSGAGHTIYQDAPQVYDKTISFFDKHLK